MLASVCLVIDHRFRQNVIRTKNWHTRQFPHVYNYTYSGQAFVWFQAKIDIKGDKSVTSVSNLKEGLEILDAFASYYTLDACQPWSGKLFCRVNVPPSQVSNTIGLNW